MPPSAMLETTIAGSLPKPEWLAPPRVLWAPWSLEGRALDEGKRDAVLLALREQEQAGIDIVTDGEQTRRHFVWGFVEQLDGIDFSKMVTIGIRADRYQANVPTVTGPVRRRGAIHGEDVRWARANTTRRLKLTIPGPMTIADTIHDAHYGRRDRLAPVWTGVLAAVVLLAVCWGQVSRLAREQVLRGSALGGAMSSGLCSGISPAWTCRRCCRAMTSCRCCAYSPCALAASLVA